MAYNIPNKKKKHSELPEYDLSNEAMYGEKRKNKEDENEKGFLNSRMEEH